MGLDESIALVSLQDAKDFLVLKDSSKDPIVENIINGVSTRFAKYCRRTLVLTAYPALYLTGSGSSKLWLPNWPVDTGETFTVTEDGTVLTEGESGDFYLWAERGLLEKAAGYYWTTKIKGVKVVMTAGWVCLGTGITMPYDVQQAALKQIDWEFKKFKTKSWGETSRSFPQGGGVSNTVPYTSSLDAGDLLKEVKATLDPHVNLRRNS